MKYIVLIFKAIRKSYEICVSGIYTPFARLLLLLNGATVGNNLAVFGTLHVNVTRRGYFAIGENCSMNSGDDFNVIGRQQKCIFWVEGNLQIGNNVGLSAAAIICQLGITIGDNVKIGGNTVIYDTDFHSLNSEDRRQSDTDKKSTQRAKVVIGNDVFIGAHTTILKGVTIGERSIIGAGSVVSKSIPPNEIWAGNPAQFIKNAS